MIRRFFQATAVYIAASIVGSALNFLLLPVLTRLLTRADYGVIGLLTATTGILGAVVGLNPHLLITVRFPEVDSRNLRGLVSAVVPITLVTAAAALVALEIVRALWPAFHLPHWVLLGLVVSAALGVGRTIGLTILQMQKRPVAYSGITVGSAVLSALLILLFVVGFRFDWRGKFLGDIAGVIIFGLVSIVFLVRSGYLSFSFEHRPLREVIRFSTPLVVHALALWALNAQDRYFVTAMVGLEANGLYSVAYTFGHVLNLIHAGVLKGFNPHFYERVRKEEEKGKIVLMTYAYLGSAVLGLVVFVGIAKLIVPVFLGRDFTSSFIYIPWVALGYTFNALRNFMTGYLYVAERTRLIGTLTLSAAVLNAVLNLLFITWYGAVGAAISTAVTFAFIAVLTTVFAVRSWPMPWGAVVKTAWRGWRKGGGG